MKNKSLRLHWWKSKNFGDNLNAYIFSKCFNIDVKYSNTWSAQAIGIGSILDRCVLQIRDIIPLILYTLNPFKRPLYVFSSGSASPLNFLSKKGRYFKKINPKAIPRG